MGAKKVMSKSYYVHTAIILVLMLGFGFLPPFGPVTALGMRVLGIFLGCIYAWTVGETIWPSILGLMLLALTGENTMAGILGSAYGNQTLLMVLFSVLFCYAIQVSGLLAVIAKIFLSMKFARKGPWMLALAFFITSWVASILTINAMPVALLLWGIFYDVCEQLDVKPYSKYATIVMVGIVICGYAGNVVMPYNGFALIAQGLLATVDPTASINPGLYILSMALIGVVLIPVLTIFFKLIGPKIDYKPVHIDAGETKFDTRQKITLGSIVLLCVLMMLPSIIPATFPFADVIKRFGSLGAIIFVPVLLMICTFKGERFLDINDGMKNGVPWGLYFLLATALTMGSAIVSADTGIAVLLNQMMAPLLAGKSAFFVMAILVALGCVITNCINNVVTISILLPIAYSYVTGAGGDPLVIVVLFMFVLLQGVVMPAGSVCGALLHGNTDWLKAGMIYKYASLGEIIVIVVLIVVGIPIVSLFF